jgi:hypothetical protein
MSLIMPPQRGHRARVTRWFEKNCPIFWKVAKTVAKQNNAKLETILNGLFRQKCNKFVAQGFGAISLMSLQKVA